jgi:hypothetical protein
MKKIIVFVLACAIAVVGLLFSELKQGALEDADFVDSTFKLIPDSASVDSVGDESMDSILAEQPITYGESYYTVDDVAFYLAEYDELPPNYMTKKEAEALGWVSSEGNLWDVAPGAVIGGDRFGNYEGLLPKGGDYTECDVNYEGGFRGGERLVYDTEGNIWYTADHYETFEPVYPQ